MASKPISVHELDLGLALVGGEEQRALELVAGVEHETFSPASSARLAAIAVASRATPPKHLPAASSSAEQVRVEALIDSIRLWKSLMCRMCSVNSAEAGPATGRIAAAVKQAGERSGGSSLPGSRRW
jgi:hypothetical protein